MISTGGLIWTSIRPLIRTFFTVAAGFVLNKAKLFPTEATRGGAQVVLNVALPCLLFSRIIPAFSTQNISSLAPLTVVGLLYGVTGALMAWTIKNFFWVPHRFRYGIFAAGCWGNYGDMPAAIALGITAAAPFKGVDDQNLAIAYISMFILVFFTTLFPLGGFLLVSKDFEGPDVPSEDLRERMYLRRRRMVTIAALSLRRFLCLSRHLNADETGDLEDGSSDLEKKDTVPFNEAVGQDEGLGLTTTDTPIPIVLNNRNYLTPTAISRSRHFLKQFLKPCTVVIVLSFVIALVDPLKALFLPPSPSFQPRFRPVAPDGQPLFAFIFDTATFIGDATVPLGLICLGSALASLSLRSGGPFPKGAIVSLALGKMVVIPIISIATIRWFVHVGFVHQDDKVLQFVCILLSGLPAASTQVYLTQIYSPTGTVEHLSAFLIPQYVLMPFTMTGLVIYTLHYLF